MIVLSVTEHQPIFGAGPEYPGRDKTGVDDNRRFE